MIQGAIASLVSSAIPSWIKQKTNRKRDANFKSSRKKTAISPIEHACFLQDNIYLSTVAHPYWQNQRLLLGRFEQFNNL